MLWIIERCISWIANQNCSLYRIYLKEKIIKLKLKTRAVIATLATAIVTLGAVPAAASEEPLPPELTANLTDVWTENGVPAATQSKLLVTLSSGEPVDAMLEAEEPVSVDSSLRDGAETTVSRYGDGSINVVSIEVPTKANNGDVSESAGGMEAPYAVEGCNTSGRNWTGCSVNGWFTGVVLAFFADIQVGRAGNPATRIPAEITRYHSPTVNCLPGVSCTTPTFELIRRTQSGSSPAQVNIVTTWTSFVGSGTTRLALYAKNGSAYTN